MQDFFPEDKEEKDDFEVELIDLYGTDKKKEKTEPEEEKTSFWKEFLSLVWTFVVALAIAVVVKEFFIINANIPSGSMENTIMTGDRLVGNRLAYLFSEPERGDIVIFKYPDNENELYVKRVVGLPGEKVTIEDAKVYIGDTLLEETYLKEEWVIGTGTYSFEIPDECYLMLGDNRNNSKDARYWTNVYVHEDKILGKALFTYWPFSNIGVLE